MNNFFQIEKLKFDKNSHAVKIKFNGKKLTIFTTKQ